MSSAADSDLDNLESLLSANLLLDELNDEAEADETDLDFLAAFCLGGIEEAHRFKNNTRYRRYLRRSELMPDPRAEGETPWQRVYASRNDRAFITTMGVDVATFDAILTAGFAARWSSQPVQRTDVRPDSSPRPGRRSLDAAGALGLILHWLSSTMRAISLQEIFALTAATVDRYIHTALDILLKTLCDMPDARLAWPTTSEMRYYSNLICQRLPLLIGAFGTVDGLNLAVQVSDDDDLENATYNGWLHDHFVSNILAFAPIGIIIWCALNAPGSWHDARVAQGLYTLLETRTPPNFYLVADSAFPHTARSIQGHIRTPRKANEPEPTEPRARRRAQEVNRQLLTCRQSAEWGMREIQGSFGRLRIPLPIADADLRFNLLEVIVRMHQLRVRRIGISQIRKYYVPIWKGDDELTEVWFHWEEMTFREIRRKDRVARFYRL
ncbi:hypothetical protein NUW54_g1823 [Trametes sanguinea]|uniref:Uncharacterized protein n=1 Tax=Trametes sanguinea TaxID=158606 RepID=A0ACC1Q7P8_9APHY|nr:hypothetical protein NUW54_g1823 [Trametes sanguinea]